MMRFALAIAMILATLASTDADNRFRRPNRIMPIRNFRIFDGYNNRFAGYDSSYYNPYSTTNSPTPVTPSPVPEDSLHPTQTYLNPVPQNWSPATTSPQPTNPTRWTAPQNSDTNTTLQTHPHKSNSFPTNYQFRSSINNYWDSFEQGGK